MITVAPITVTQALPFVRRVHRRLPRVQGGMWAIQALRDGHTVGVAIVGAPARAWNDQALAVLRVAVVDGVPNACSKLYGACARAARAMGARNLVTYTHADEHGASLRAAGWIHGGMTNGGEHYRDGRPRLPAVDPLPKNRWWAPWSERATADKRARALVRPGTIGSLFAGIGGLELGLERAGLGPTVWQVEQDPFCRRVLAHHWPEATRHEDVREVGAHNLEPVDLLCGGFPCQDISVAGRGAGLAGARSGLWFEFARVIRELRPGWVVVENVPTLLARGADTVLGDLAACGYDAVWDCIPATAVGAPHRRDRLFVVARRVSDAERNRVREQPERGEGRAQAAHRGNAEPQHVGEVMADAHCAERCGRTIADTGQRPSTGSDCMADPDRLGQQAERRGLRPDLEVDRQTPQRRRDADGRDLPEWPPAPGDMQAWRQVPPSAFPAFCRLADGLPDGLGWAAGRGRRQALKAYGNAVVPAVAEVIGHAIQQAATEVARAAPNQERGSR